MLKGDLVDNDGYIYKEGDFVSFLSVEDQNIIATSPSGYNSSYRIEKVVDLDMKKCNGFNRHY